MSASKALSLTSILSSETFRSRATMRLYSFRSQHEEEEPDPERFRAQRGARGPALTLNGREHFSDYEGDDAVEPPREFRVYVAADILPEFDKEDGNLLNSFAARSAMERRAEKMMPVATTRTCCVKDGNSLTFESNTTSFCHQGWPKLRLR